jgi:hypothetical protein
VASLAPRHATNKKKKRKIEKLTPFHGIRLRTRYIALHSSANTPWTLIRTPTFPPPPLAIGPSTFFYKENSFLSFASATSHS